MFCSNCGNKLEEDKKFCTSCGTENFSTDSNIINNTVVEESQIIFTANDNSKKMYADFFTRVWAYLIDIVILFLIGFAVAMILGIFGLLSKGIADILGLIIGILYFATQESSLKQATFGKQIMKLKVVDENYQRISFGRAVGRYFGRVLSGLILGIGFLMIFFTDKKQALHDKLLSTLVIRAN